MSPLAGLVAFTADEEHNTLTVVGDEEALGEVRSILRFVDIPATQLRLAVRTLAAGEAAVKATEANGQQLTGSLSAAPLKWVAVAEGKAAAALAAAPATTEFELAAVNNRSVRLQWAADGKKQWPGSSLTPRINGDGSVTGGRTATMPPVRRGACGWSGLRRGEWSARPCWAVPSSDALAGVARLHPGTPAEPPYRPRGDPRKQWLSGLPERPSSSSPLPKAARQ